MCVKRVPQKNRKSSAPVERNFFDTKYGENKGKSFEIRRFRSFLGGDKRDRTADLLNAMGHEVYKMYSKSSENDEFDVI